MSGGARSSGRAAPNAGHLALVALARKVPKLTLITQNVDGLHQQAGSERVIELHGNLMRNRCFNEDVEISDTPQTDQAPPPCPHCGGYLRPDVIWFGESLPLPALQAAQLAARNCDLFFSIGTSALVHPAASLPLEAIQQGILTVEINPVATPLTPHVTYSLPGPAGVILPALLRVDLAIAPVLRTRYSSCRKQRQSRKFACYCYGGKQASKSRECT